MRVMAGEALGLQSNEHLEEPKITSCFTIHPVSDNISSAPLFQLPLHQHKHAHWNIFVLPKKVYFIEIDTAPFLSVGYSYFTLQFNSFTFSSYLLQRKLSIRTYVQSTNLK